MRTLKVGIYTLGCRVNQYESDAIAQLLQEQGYEIAPFDGECDIYVINTCTVTAESDRKCRQMINRAAKRKSQGQILPVVAVLGCYTQKLTQEQRELLSNADYIGGNGNKTDFIKALPNLLNGGKEINVQKISEIRRYEKMSLNKSKNIRAYVKIEDGCNNFCSYCLVPYARGRVRSREEADIINEVNGLVIGGYKEIILTGIETAAYGEDLDSKEPLASLIETLADKTGIQRIRIGSLNPGIFTESFTKRLSEVPQLLPHFHLSAQSASSKILKLMRRRYDREELYRAVYNIRNYFKNVNLSSDLICGFPHESEEDFTSSMDFISDSRLLHAHVFPFSLREGTAAAKMDGQIDVKVRKERAERMIKHAEEVRAKVLTESFGKEFKVLIEAKDKGAAFGYTENYIYTRLDDSGEYGIGDIGETTLRKENC